MALQYSYFVDQADCTREPYSYKSSPASTEKKGDSFQLYPSFYKIFNKRRSFGEANSGSQQAPVHSHNNVGAQPKAHHPAQKVRFAEQREVIGGGGGHNSKEVDAVEEESVDAAADGFINWKRRSLQICKTFAD